MNNIATLKRQTGTKDILLAGFRKSLFEYLIPPCGNDRSYYRFEDIENLFRARQWLEFSLVQGQLPFGIICHLSELELDEFRFLRQVNKHPVLRNLPFIVIAEKDAYVNIQGLLKAGIDDCYCGQVSWADIYTRLTFLRMYKETLLEEPDPEKAQLPGLTIGERIYNLVRLYSK